MMKEGSNFINRRPGLAGSVSEGCQIDSEKRTANMPFRERDLSGLEQAGNISVWSIKLCKSLFRKASQRGLFQLNSLSTRQNKVTATAPSGVGNTRAMSLILIIGIELYAV